MRQNVFTSLIPFAIFVVTTIGISFLGAADISLLTAAGVFTLLLGAFLAKNTEWYWNVIIDYFGSRTTVTAALLWLLAGVYGSILNRGHLAEGLICAAEWLDIDGTVFTVGVFLFSSLFAVSTGSGFGTISAMSLTLFPAGVVLGADSALLGGAILSGAAFGDSIAPVSDTAVIAATTQVYDNGKSVADIGGTIRQRFPFAGVAMLLTLLLFFLAGLMVSEPIRPVAKSHPAMHPAGLAMLVPTFVVILLSFRRVHIFKSLFIGILLAIVIGLSLNLFDISELINLRGGKVGGAVVDGVASMSGICILLMVVVSLSGIIIRSGCMERVVERLNDNIIHTHKSAELTIFSLVALAGILVAAVNTIANICVAPFVNSIGQRNGLHPYRRATLLATVICTFPFILPYGGCVLLLQKGIEASGCGAGIKTTDVFFTAFYPWILFVVMLIVCMTGYKAGYKRTVQRKRKRRIR